MMRFVDRTFLLFGLNVVVDSGRRPIGIDETYDAVDDGTANQLLKARFGDAIDLSIYEPRIGKSSTRNGEAWRMRGC